MKYVLVKFQKNYADEFDVQGWRACPKHIFEEELTLLKENFHKTEGSAEYYFGSNEELRFRNITEALSCYDVKEITHDEYQTLVDLFGETIREWQPYPTHGMFISPIEIIEDYLEEGEDE